jgi:ribosomal protein S18 acetylase RimI-like enzyme
MMSDKILQDADDSQIIEAIEENFCSFGTTQLGRWSRIEVHDEPDLLWFKSDVPAPSFNTNLRARLSPENVDLIIARQQAAYAERNLPLLWWTNPSSTPPEIGRHLISAGFVHHGELAGMAMDLNELVDEAYPDDLVIEPAVGTIAQQNFAQTLCQAFDTPQALVEPMIEQSLAMDYGPGGPLVNYIGFLDGQPVTTASLYLESGVAGIYNVSTLPAYRGRGFGTAVTLAPLLEAKKRGYRFSVLHSSSMAISLYRRLGFKTYCYFHQYLWPNPAQDK